MVGCAIPRSEVALDDAEQQEGELARRLGVFMHHA